MNKKHLKILRTIFATPTAKSLSYRDVKTLLIALGCDFEEREGSRVCFSKDQHAVGMHRPHPGKELKEYQVKEIKGFLMKIGMDASE